MNKLILLSLFVFLIHTVSYASVALADEVPVTWQNAVGVSIDNNNNNLTKTAPHAWGNSGASSVESLLSGDGYVTTVIAETNSTRMIGLSNGDSNQSYTDGDFFIYPAFGVVQVYEKGVIKFNGDWERWCTGEEFIDVEASTTCNVYLKPNLLFIRISTVSDADELFLFLIPELKHYNLHYSFLVLLKIFRS